MGTKKERDEAKEESQVAWLAAVVTGDVRVTWLGSKMLWQLQRKPGQ